MPRPDLRSLGGLALAFVLLWMIATALLWAFGIGQAPGLLLGAGVAALAAFLIARPRD